MNVTIVLDRFRLTSERSSAAKPKSRSMILLTRDVGTLGIAEKFWIYSQTKGSFNLFDVHGLAQSIKVWIDGNTGSLELVKL